MADSKDRSTACYLCIALLTLSVILITRITTASGTRVSPAGPVKEYANLPMSFEPNRDPLMPDYAFIARGSGYSLQLKPDVAALRVRGSDGVHRLEMHLTGTNPHSVMSGVDRLPGEANHFSGPRQNWRTHIPMYRKVYAESVYPGVDVSWYGNAGLLEYDLMVKPGASIRDINMTFDGSSNLRISEKGDLVINVAGHELIQKKPAAYQDIAGGRKTVEASYAMHGENAIGFQVGTYDTKVPLVIDPQLVYSLVLGFGLETQAVTVDSSGNAYICGGNFSDFRINDSTDAFVEKINAAGTAVVFSNTFGAEGGSDAANAVAVDLSGNVYVTGYTPGSVNIHFPSFPTLNPIQPTHTNQGTTAFVTKFDATGNMVYSTTLGGSTSDRGMGIAVDSLGNMYVAGVTASVDFPTFHPMQSALAGPTDAFVTALNAQGSAFIYSTFVGGSGDDSGNGLALDSSANAYVTGKTTSLDFPSFNPIAGAGGAFLFKLNAAGSAFGYSTYVNEGSGNGIALDAAGNAYIVGTTAPGAGGTDVFVRKVNATGTAFVYSTHVGGSRDDQGSAIALDGSGNAYITGTTLSGDFPQSRPIEVFNSASPGFDTAAFATKVTTTGTVDYSTLLFGGRAPSCEGFNSGTGIASDTNGTVFVTGHSDSLVFPTTPSPVNGTQICSRAFDGGSFLVKLANDTVSATPISLIQSNSAQGSGVSSLSAGFPSANHAGNLIIAFVRMSTTSQTVSVTDSLGNSYADAVSQGQTIDGHQVHIFYARNIRGGANTVTASFSSANNHPWIAVYEYSGLIKLDQTAHAQGSDASPFSGLIATTSPNELEFSATGLPASFTGTVSPGSGYAMQLQDTATSRAANETAILNQVNNNFAGRFSLSSSSNWTIVVATFAGAGNAPLQITSTGLPNGTLNQPYSVQLTASGGTAPYTFQLIPPAGSSLMPPGLTLNSSTGVISGTPSVAGAFTFVVSATDAASNVVYKIFNINIPSPPSITQIQANSVEGSGVGSLSLPFKSNNNVSNLIIAVVRFSTTFQNVTVTDSAGDSFTDAVSQAQNADGSQIHIFYAKNIVGGPNTVTAAFSSTNNHPWLAIYEFAGLNTTNPLEATAHAQGADASPTAGTVPAMADSLAFEATGLPASYTGSVQSSDFTLSLQDTGTSRAATQSAVVGGQATAKFTLSSPANWSAVFATFRQ